MIAARIGSRVAMIAVALMLATIAVAREASDRRGLQQFLRYMDPARGPAAVDAVRRNSAETFDVLRQLQLDLVEGMQPTWHDRWRELPGDP